MKKGREFFLLKIIRTIFALSLFCWVLISNSCSSRGEGKKAVDTSQEFTADVVVLTGTVLENNVFTTGSLISNEFIELRAPIAGMVMEMDIREGERVKTGQKLVQLDDREWQAQLQRFKALLDVAEKNFKRNTSLLEINGISQEVVDQAEGNVATLKANIAEVQVKIDQAAVVAPFDGYVGLRNISMGEFVTAGSSMASLVQNNPIKLDFSLPGKYASLLRPGQEVYFSVDGIADTTKAFIYAVDPRLDATSRTVRVRAKAENTTGKLFPGAFANIRVNLDKISKAIVVPTEAVVPELNGQKVYKVKNGKALGQQVNLGIRSGRAVQITDGLAEGDTVLVTGLLQVREEMPVRIGQIINQIQASK